MKFDKMYIAKTRKSPIGPTPFPGLSSIRPRRWRTWGKPVLPQPHHQKAKTMLMQNLEAQTRFIMGNEKVANRVAGIVALKTSLQDSYKRGHSILAAISMFS